MNPSRIVSAIGVACAREEIVVDEDIATQRLLCYRLLLQQVPLSA